MSNTPFLVRGPALLRKMRHNLAMRIRRPGYAGEGQRHDVLLPSWASSVPVWRADLHLSDSRRGWATLACTSGLE